MKNFKIGDRVVLNNNISDDSRVIVSPGDMGVIAGIQTFKSCDVCTIQVWIVNSQGRFNIVFVPDELDLAPTTPIESIPDYWESDVLMAMGYRGLI